MTKWMYRAALLLLLACAGVIGGCASEDAAPNSDIEEMNAAFWRTDWTGRGAELYRQNCATCHGDEGEGIHPYFPALAGSALVQGPVGGVVILPMYGRGAMPSFAEILDDQDMAIVLSHIRSQWGNNAPAISPEQVAPFRQPGVEVPQDPILGGDA
jgi:mono/diheme cytochrome c family protein